MLRALFTAPQRPQLYPQRKSKIVHDPLCVERSAEEAGDLALQAAASRSREVAAAASRSAAAVGRDVERLTGELLNQIVPGLRQARSALADASIAASDAVRFCVLSVRTPKPELVVHALSWHTRAKSDKAALAVPIND